MSQIVLHAEPRTDFRKSANRRLRRLESKVPAIIYGGSKDAEPVHLEHKAVMKALENEAIYSSVFTVQLKSKKESVILKAIQRHPFKVQVMHMDFQRVSPKDILVKQIPLHFIHEEEAPGLKAGGIVTHTMNQIEIKCQAQDLPEFIEVDLSHLELNQVIHLSEIKLPKGVHLSIEDLDKDHDHPVVSVHMPRVEAEPEVEAATEEETSEETSSEETVAGDEATSEEESKED